MLFAIIGTDSEDSKEKRVIHREAHLANLKILKKEGKLFLAGPFTDTTGSLIIIDVDSLEEAENFIQNDPYVMHGVFHSYQIKPFKKVFPEN
ncbi:MAG: YciI family protein [Leptospirales bacterium]